MPERTLMEISIFDKAYFDVFIGRRVLHDELQHGETATFPVYSANPKKPLGYLDHSNVDDFSCDCVIWGIDGNWDFAVLGRNQPFATTDHCGTIRVKDANIRADYLLRRLEIARQVYGYDRTLRASLKAMAPITVPIPFCDGQFDVQEQDRVVRQYRTVDSIRGEVSGLLREVLSQTIEVTVDCEVEGFSVDRVFKFLPTNSGVTWEFCRAHLGTVPVYGCSEDGSKLLGRIADGLPEVKYYSNSITYNRNGSVGRFFVRYGTFATNEDHRVLSVRDEFRDTIDLEYMRFALEVACSNEGFGYTNKLGAGRLGGVLVDIPVVLGTSTPDLGHQQVLARRYSRLHELWRDTVDQLEALLSLSVDLT